MPILTSILLGQSFAQAIRGSEAFIKFVRSEPPYMRVLLLLHEEFKDEGQLTRDQVLAWQKDDDLLRAPLDALLEGRATPGGAELRHIAAALEAKLVRTPEGERPELARRMADRVPEAVAVAHTTADEATAYLVNQAARQTSLLERLAAGADDTRDDAVAGALVRGPLVQAGLELTAATAERQVAAEQWGPAAASFERIAEGLQGGTLPELSDAYLVRAAEAARQGGDLTRARRLLTTAIWARLDRGQPVAARLLIDDLHELSASEADGVAALAVEAEVLWPEDEEAALAALRAGLEVEGAGSEQRARWRDALLTALALAGSWEALLEEDGPADWREGGHALSAHLTRLLALAERDGLAAVEVAWDEVLLWAEKQPREVAGLVAARRGLQLAQHDRVADSVASYRMSLRAWADVAGGLEEAGQQLFNSQGVSIRATGRAEDLELGPLARSATGDSARPAAVERRLTASATTALLAERLPDALLLLQHARAVAHRSGAASSLTELDEMLARLLERAERPGAALGLYLDAGRTQDAERVASGAKVEEVERAVSRHRPAWRRAVGWAIVEQEGPRLSEEWVASNLQQLLEDVEGEPSGQWVADPVLLAPPALAAVLLQVADDQLPEALRVVRMSADDFTFVGHATAACKALLASTELGRSDEAQLLVDVILKADWPVIAPFEVAQAVRRGSADLSVVRSAAAGGSREALELLAALDEVHGEAVVEQVDRALEEYTAAVTVERTPEQITAHMGMRFEPAGLFAKHGSESARERVVERLLEIVVSDEEPLPNRASALNALYNATPALSADQLQQAWEVAAPLAAGDVVGSRFDHGPPDPLSRARISVPGAAEAIGSALHLIGRLAHGRPELADDARRLLEAGLLAQQPAVRAGALDGLQWAQQPMTGTQLDSLLVDADLRVRCAALQHAAKVGRRLTDVVQRRLLQDPHPAVRSRLIPLARAGDTGLLEALRHDPDVRVRLRAREVEHE